MKVVCNLADLLAHNDVTPKEAAEKSKVDLRTIKNLLSPETKWQLPRHALENLMLYAFESEFSDPLFTLREHAIWSTFTEKGSYIFRGQRHWDAGIESELVQFIRRLGGRAEAEFIKPSDRRPSADIAHSMKMSNCIFLGTPKSNSATEIALALLADAKPFDTTTANREKLAIHVMGIEDSQNESAVLFRSTRHGFDVAAPGARHRKFTKVDWKSREDYDEWRGTARDAAGVVVCRRPLGTSEDVTTIIIMGYSGLATQTAARELIHGDPPLAEDMLAKNGVQHVLAYTFDFKKSKRTNVTSDNDQRRVVKGTGRWHQHS